MTPIFSYQARSSDPEIITIMKTDTGLFSPMWSVDFGELSQDQQVDFIASLESPDPCPDDIGSPEDYTLSFRTIAEAVEYANAIDEANSIYQDLSAFNAPPECYEDAMKPSDARVAAARAKAV
jgi:hypothetical protein